MKTNVLVLTCKGRKDLTKDFFESISKTIDDVGTTSHIIIIDAGEDHEVLNSSEIAEWLDGSSLHVHYKNWLCTLTEGWNQCIQLARKLGLPADEVNIHLMQNDSIFLKSGWLKAIIETLDYPNAGSVGTSRMSVFGHVFVTGAIQSFNLFNGLMIAEEGVVVDERFNHAYPDVDLCVRFEKAGYNNYLVEGLEYGDDPAIKHLISQTMYTTLGLEKTIALRAEEEVLFLAKHGRKDNVA